MTQCEKDFFLLNTVTTCDLKNFDGKLTWRKYFNKCLPFENKFQHKGKISLEYASKVTQTVKVYILKKNLNAAFFSLKFQKETCGKVHLDLVHLNQYEIIWYANIVWSSS